MGKNRDFGLRVRQAREDLGCGRGTLARLVGITSQRLTLIEIGKLDDSDLSRPEKSALAEVLRLSVDWLVSGPILSEPTAKYSVVVAQRSSEGPVQQPLSYGPGLCPRCYLHSEGSRCDRCGHPVE